MSGERCSRALRSVSGHKPLHARSFVHVRAPWRAEPQGGHAVDRGISSDDTIADTPTLPRIVDVKGRLNFQVLYRCHALVDVCKIGMARITSFRKLDGALPAVDRGRYMVDG